MDLRDTVFDYTAFLVFRSLLYLQIFRYSDPFCISKCSKTFFFQTKSFGFTLPLVVRLEQHRVWSRSVTLAISTSAFRVASFSALCRHVDISSNERATKVENLWQMFSTFQPIFRCCTHPKYGQHTFFNIFTHFANGLVFIKDLKSGTIWNPDK